MKKGSFQNRAGLDFAPVATELLILDDGRVLAHHLSPALAELLSDLNPTDESMKQRAARAATTAPCRPAACETYGLKDPAPG